MKDRPSSVFRYALSYPFSVSVVTRDRLAALAEDNALCYREREAGNGLESTRRKTEDGLSKLSCPFRQRYAG